MKIVVCIKQVPDTAARIKVMADGKGIETSELSYVVNPYDEYAVEEALRIREEIGGEVVVICVGPNGATEAIRTCLAMGADRAIHINDAALQKADPFVRSRATAKAVAQLEADLVLCGKETVDDNSPFLGPALAEFLNLPQATVVTKLTVAEDGKTITVEREGEGCREVLEIPLPAVVTAQKGLNEPRYASLPGIMKAKKKEIKVMDAKALGLLEEELSSRVEILSVALPPERTAGKVIPGEPAESVKELVRLLKEEAKAL